MKTSTGLCSYAMWSNYDSNENCALLRSPKAVFAQLGSSVHA
jgi:hypothetical protein